MIRAIDKTAFTAQPKSFISDYAIIPISKKSGEILDKFVRPDIVVTQKAEQHPHWLSAVISYAQSHGAVGFVPNSK